MAIIGTGRHDVKVSRTGLADDSEGKTPAVIVQFENDAGDSITAYLYLSEKSWPFTEEKLTTLGWEPVKNGCQFEVFNDDPSPIVGHAAEIVVDEEQYEGKTRHKVKFINPVGGRIERMQPAAASAFADRLRRRLLQGGGGATTQTPRQQARPAADDDQIPF